ncbi:ABC transporter ATP-binding protein [Laceyella putida]|uniref:ATP-binding cassette domain-containing protein n=1 Tax=Laceyella putida TaxID=110101 RepID=A0ABW2RG86_9BACL
MIQVHELTKEFATATTGAGVMGAFRSLFSREAVRKVAVDHISFAIETGECVGYLGPNGAGKSTTIKMLAGILHPTSGDISVLGYHPGRERKQLAYQMGVVFGQRTQLWWDLPLRDSYEILRHMYHLDERRYRQFLEKVDHLLEIGQFLDTPVRKLSLGQRMRADLAAALIHDPPLLFLDEPTIGLDVVAKERIRRFLKELSQEQGKTILLTTHDMDDIAYLCHRVLVINHGKLVLDGSMETLRSRIGLPSVIRILFQGIPNVQPLAEAEKVETDGAKVTIYYDRQKVSPPTILNRVSAWGDWIDVEMAEPEIEEMIKRIYR